jgi:hypothetical protein
MSQTIPTTDLPYYTIKVRLEDADYTLSFYTATRRNRIYFDILDAEDVPICRGLKCVPGVSLLRPYRFRGGLPPGEIQVNILNGTDQSPPKLGELGSGKRCELTYFTRAEVLDALI